jgi:hypothetical protein
MPDWMKTVIVGFIAGVISILIFHQGSLWLAGQMGLLKPTLYNMRPVPPWGVPTIVSQCFWGGLWGIAGALIVERLPGYLKGVLGWILFAAIVPTLANWFIVAPLKNSPMGYGFRAPGVYVVLGVYAAWGFGMWLIARIERKLFRWP